MPAPVRLSVRGSLVRGPQRAEIYLSSEDMAAAVGLSPARLARLVQLGLIESTDAGGRRFTAAAAARLRRMLRLQRDLGVNLDSAAIIVDLVERLEELEREQTRHRGR
jgi:DNA-binding transcriptional MerR regulator